MGYSLLVNKVAFPQCFFLLLSYVQASSNLILVFWSVSSVFSKVSTLACLAAPMGQANPSTRLACSTIALMFTKPKHQWQTWYRSFLLCHQLGLQIPVFVVESSIAFWILKCRTWLEGHRPYQDLMVDFPVGKGNQASCYKRPLSPYWCELLLCLLVNWKWQTNASASPSTLELRRLSSLRCSRSSSKKSKVFQVFCFPIN